MLEWLCWWYSIRILTEFFWSLSSVNSSRHKGKTSHNQCIQIILWIWHYICICLWKWICILCCENIIWLTNTRIRWKGINVESVIFTKLQVQLAQNAGPTGIANNSGSRKWLPQCAFWAWNRKHYEKENYIISRNSETWMQEKMCRKALLVFRERFTAVIFLRSKIFLLYCIDACLPTWIFVDMTYLKPRVIKTHMKGSRKGSPWCPYRKLKTTIKPNETANEELNSSSVTS